MKVVGDVKRSIDWYRARGEEVATQLNEEEGTVNWAEIKRGNVSSC